MFERQHHAKGAVRRARRLRGDMKPAERKLWRELRKLGAHIRRQAPIGPYIADFACHSRNLVIEVDGEIHGRLPEVALRDLERADWLRTQGYTVLRFTNRQVEANISAVIDEVKRHLALPLDGEALGWGGGNAVELGPLETPTSPELRPSSQQPHPTPNPSPSRGGDAPERDADA